MYGRMELRQKGQQCPERRRLDMGRGVSCWMHLMVDSQLLRLAADALLQRRHRVGYVQPSCLHRNATYSTFDHGCHTDYILDGLHAN